MLSWPKSGAPFLLPFSLLSSHSIWWWNKLHVRIRDGWGDERDIVCGDQQFFLVSLKHFQSNIFWENELRCSDIKASPTSYCLYYKDHILLNLRVLSNVEGRGHIAERSIIHCEAPLCLPLQTELTESWEMCPLRLYPPSRYLHSHHRVMTTVSLQEQ